MTPEELLSLLRGVGLSHLCGDDADCLLVVSPWTDMLSIGEQQRLAFARLFYHVRAQRPLPLAVTPAARSLAPSPPTSCVASMSISPP